MVLCLDGPLNGMWANSSQVVSAATSTHGYRLDIWPTGEEVFVWSKFEPQPDTEMATHG